MTMGESLTPFEKTTLDNGLRIVTSTMPHAHSVAVSIYIAAGSRYETQPESGVSHFIEHMLFKGTEKRPNAQIISEAIDNVGGVMNAATDREYTVYYAKVARNHLALATDVLVDPTQTSRPGTLTVFLEPLYEGVLDGLPPGGNCIVNVYTNNYDLYSQPGVGTGRYLLLHAIDAVGVVHAMILRIQAILLPVQTLVLGGH